MNNLDFSIKNKVWISIDKFNDDIVWVKLAGLGRPENVRNKGLERKPNLVSAMLTRNEVQKLSKCLQEMFEEKNV